MMKRGISIFLALCLVLTLMPQTAWAAESSGMCGDNLTWTIDADGILRISGTGPMSSWTMTPAPWHNRATSIKYIVIEDGVTGIGACAFENSRNFTEITLPYGLESIHSSAFRGCSNLATLRLPSSINTIGQNAFLDCNSLSEVYYGGSESQWDNVTVSPNENGNASLLNATIHYQDYNALEPGVKNVPYAQPTADTEAVEKSNKDFRISEGVLPKGLTLNQETAELTGVPTESGTFYFTVSWTTTVTSVVSGPTGVRDDEVTITRKMFFALTITETANNPASSTAQIKELFPTHNGTTPGAMFDITFDREIAESSTMNVPDADITKGYFKIYRQSDDELIWETNPFSLTNNLRYGASRQVLRINPTNQSTLLRSGETYYVVMSPGFVRFADGSDCPGIQKGDWVFTVKAPDPATPPPDSTRKTVRLTLFGTGFGNVMENVVWDDNWFSNPATSYNHELAIASVALSGSAYVEVMGTGVRTALNTLGFQNPKTYDYEAPMLKNLFGNGTVGHTFAAKDIQVDGKTYKLVAIVIRGTQDMEWASNILDNGMWDSNSGFEDASRAVLRNLNQYLKDNNIDTSNPDAVKFLVTGHSRGGIVANLTAADLTTNTVLKKSPNKFGNNVYCYTVASPLVSFNAAHGKSCDNIFNIINPRDVVTKVPCANVYFRYGTDLFLPSKYNFRKQKEKETYREFSGKMESTFYTLTKEEFYDNFLAFAKESTLCAHSIATYYSWMSRYTADELFGNVNVYSAPTFKKLVVACPVDVHVYDEAGSIAASVVNEEVVVDQLLVEVEDGVKTVYLPLDQDYDVRIEAREKGTVRYTMSEMVLQAGGEAETRTVTFDEISIVPDDVLTGTVNDDIATPVSNYTLTKTTTGGIKTTIPAASDTLSSDQEVTFADVQPGAYFYDAVAWAVKQGVTNGTSSTTFSPGNPCTRAQIVTFLWRAMGSPEPASSTSRFKDVQDPKQYYYKAVQWAVENGITDGTSSDTFSPSGICTRSQAVTFLWRANNEPQAGSSSAFNDVAKGGYYEEAVNWAIEKGITNGAGAGKFNPGGTCTRGQIVTFLYRDKNSN